MVLTCSLVRVGSYGSELYDIVLAYLTAKNTKHRKVPQKVMHLSLRLLCASSAAFAVKYAST